MNIAEFPITLLADRAPRGQRRIEYADRIFDPGSGREIDRRLVISAPEEYGLPTAIDDDVILALIQLTRRQNGFAKPEVYFSRLQLIDLLGWPDKGRSYDRIAASLDRWASTYLKYENAWWDNEGRCWTSGGFHIIDSYKLGDGRASGGRGSRCRVVWGREFFKSCQAGYLKGLDYDLYIRLTSHPARRMYRFLDKRFYHKAEWEFELKDFAFEHVGLSRTYRDAGKIKEKLRRGIEELEEVGFLVPLRPDERFVKQGRRWVIRMTRAQAEPAEEPPPGVGADPIVRDLVDRGVTPATAVELATSHPAGAIARQVEAFDWLISREDRRVRLSPSGYLVEAIRKDFALPRGFASKADREARRRESEDLFSQGHQDRLRERERAARGKADREAIDRFWEALGPSERSQVDDQALAVAPPEVVEAYRGMTPASLKAVFFRDTVRDPFILGLIRGDAPAAT
ncbi:replication initiator protein A [Tautonia plasticadhaerens]|uniref:Replication initiator protein A n=1 Tax=Tautonia plasticadhaerens TaxID=2527974 RepID=A0A518HFN0_9BACT|nr:replication initiator protein A [Tautonia plasticadhaerens]QDV39650.1 Replication initiator protein A [Tautonia plasticadhaerens]